MVSAKKKPILFSGHALRRSSERTIADGEIEDIIRTGQMTQQPGRGDHGGIVCLYKAHRNGRVVVVVAENARDAHYVITAYVPGA